MSRKFLCYEDEWLPLIDGNTIVDNTVDGEISTDKQSILCLTACRGSESGRRAHILTVIDRQSTRSCNKVNVRSTASELYWPRNHTRQSRTHLTLISTKAMYSSMGAEVSAA